MVEDALRNQSERVVISEIEKALREGKEHHLAWVLDWATSYKIYELEEIVKPYADHDSPDISINVKLFLNSKAEDLGEDVPYPDVFD
jgi:hypothetical protein